MATDEMAPDMGEMPPPEGMPAVEEGMPAGDTSDLEDEDIIEVETMEATATCIGAASTLDLFANTSAIGSATVEGDAEVSTSLIGVVNAGSLGLYQGAAAALIADGEASLDQAYSQVVVARGADLESSGAGVLVAGEANLARSWVGIMAARNATLSDDSRVIIDARAGLIIGAFLFGGLGLVAAAFYFGARKVASRIPHMPWMHHAQPAHRMPQFHMPDMPKLPELPKMPDMASVGEFVAKLRHHGG